MKKRLLSTLLALCVALALLPVAALAAGTSGSCGKNVTWSYNNGTLTFQGTGAMDNFEADQQPWSDYLEQIHTVIIGDGITSIGDDAFFDCANLSSITIPNSVTRIGDGPFYWCTSLTSITIPSSVTTIEAGAFVGSGLTSVVIPDGVKTIEISTFNLCEKLTSVTIPASVTTIKDLAFYWCNSLTDVYYGGSKEQWDKINIEEGGDSLADATIHYNSAPSTPSTPAPSGISVTVAGKTVEWTDAAPFIDANSRTMVPLRAVADAMKLTVNWDANAREASFSNGSKTIYFPIDSNSARTSSGGAVQMDTAAVIANERTYAPIRYLAEYFGYTVGWDAATQTVILK